MTHRILFFILLISFSGCVSPDEAPQQIGEVEGLKPIYVEAGAEKTIRASAAREINRLGKIYYKDPLIFVNESNIGVHVFDNTDPSNPINVQFLEIPGCEDIAIRGNYLYADNLTDLVTVDITDLANPEVVHRLENIKPLIEEGFPPNYEGYFECVDNNRGVVIGWEETVLNNPECSIFN